MGKPTVFVALLALTASLMTTTPARALDTTATSETTVYGSVAGTFAQTQAADDDWEVLTEETTPGRSGRSRLEHVWTFQVPSNNSVTFWVDGHRSSGGDDPAFGFSYSLDGGSSWTTMFDVTEVVDTTHTFELPAGTSGAVLVQVIDGDRTRGNAALDSVYVDHMYFVTDGDPPINTPPTAADDSATTPSGGSVLISVLENDTDPDDGIDASTVVAGQGSNGSTTVDGDGVVTYTHDGSPTTTDTFAYTVKDMAGQESNSATVTVTITPPNDPPIAGNDSATV
ncbi:MAG: cadherin-like domain-containing protein, partial [Acidimicrobiia bacterium]|nr:cadherin-like domain-containing protein [Acidimicrobiia bacterium]